MRAIMLMFDSLSRRRLPPYGDQTVHAPNFTRLAGRTATFDTCYAGSMPCMPARRELQTGRYNFLHRSWGPLEPFDDSMPQILDEHGIHTHLATDHQHYWEDGGATYHNRYTTYDLIRGQEGDAWRGDVDAFRALGSPQEPEQRVRAQDQINRRSQRDEADLPQRRTIDAGLEFIETNHAADSWFLQLETFDPHEPFVSADRFQALYPENYDGPELDWPTYTRVREPEATVEHVRRRYEALVSMCDASVGRVLDAMDAHDMWQDTMLIVATDHGFLLGEHGWWGKMTMPWYDELIHTPLFIYDPRSQSAGERRQALVQTIDLAPTLLELFELSPTPDMQGVALRDTIADDTPVRDAALFGGFGGHVNVTDGRHVYMRAPATAENAPLHEHTLMTTHMRWRFTPEELRGAQLIDPLPFTKDTPVLQIPATFVRGDAHTDGTLLFDLDTDPTQSAPVDDPALEERMIQLLLNALSAAMAPRSQYERLGLTDQVPDDAASHG